MLRKKYRAAIVGCGRIASLFANDKKRKGIVTHAQAYGAHPRTELVAACDRDLERLSEFGKRWGVRNLYQNLDEMLQKEKPDFLSICTWNASHAPIVKEAIRCGVKGLICEKPISDSLPSAEKMIRECQGANVPLLINYFRRYNVLHRRIQKYIISGKLGDIQTVSCYYTAGIMNTGTHLFDLLRFLFGEVSWVWTNPDRVLLAPDPTLDVTLYFKKGFGCNVSALEVRHYMQFEIDIYGTRGRLRLEDSGMRAKFWKVKDHEVYSGYKTLKADAEWTADFSDGFFNLVDNLVTSVEKQKEPSCSGWDGLKTLEIAFAAHQSLQKRKPISLPLKNCSLRLASK